jgi:hypothetical protein
VGEARREGGEIMRGWKKRAEKIVGGERGKWGKRGLRRLVFGHNGEEEW